MGLYCIYTMFVMLEDVTNTWVITFYLRRLQYHIVKNFYIIILYSKSTISLCMLKQTSLPLKTDVSNLVCSMQRNWRLILQILHTTVFLILYMKMLTINNPCNTIQPFNRTPSKITLWKFWYKFGWHRTYCNSWKPSIVKSKTYF